MKQAWKVRKTAHNDKEMKVKTNKNIYAFARWVDTSNHARAGSWTGMVVSGIL